ncbi:hypothetical protein AALM99_08650 [Lactococcus muris]|uniref:Uncharacterized protein n=1 Tax=Lactococcus muris TaxID=2941330 RepID=A0ABV4DD11_9LACT
MILYYAALPVHLQSILVHKMTLHPDEEAILLFQDDTETEMYEGYRELEGSGLNLKSMCKSSIFKNIIVAQTFISRKAQYDNLQISDMNDHIVNSFDILFERLNVQLETLDTIYVTYEHDADFSFYLEERCIPHFVIESGKNDLSRLIAMNPKIGFPLNFENHVFWTLDGVGQAVIRSDSEDTLKHWGNKIKAVFDYNQALAKLTDNQLSQIYIFYNHIEIDYPEQATMILLVNPRGKHFWSIRRSELSQFLDKQFGSKWDYQLASKHLWAQEQLAFDFYTEYGEPLMLKYHPRAFRDDVKSKQLFGPSAQVMTILPIDFLKLRFKQKLKKAIVFASTAGDFVSELAEEQVLLTEDMGRTHIDYFKLYIALRFLIENFENPIIYALPPYLSQINLLLRHHFETTIEAQKYHNAIEITPQTFILAEFLDPNFNRSANVIFFNGIRRDVSIQNLNILEIYKNTDEAEVFFDLSSENLYFYHENNIWDYNDRLVEKLNKISITKALPYSKIQLKAKLPSYKKQYEILSTMLDSWKLSKLESDMEYVRSTLQSTQYLVQNYLVPSLSKEEMSAVLPNITDFSAYLDILYELRGKHVIVIAVRDTAGYLILAEQREKIKKIGFEKFDSSTQIPFSGISNQGEVIEQTGPQNTNTSVDLLINAKDIIEVSSSPFKSGNYAQLKINDHDYAVNRRGINIVVYDAEKSKVLDSVAFDMHDPQMKVYR